jgi:hypothetical protein
VNANERAVDQCVEWALRTNLGGETPPDLRARIAAAARAAVPAAVPPAVSGWRGPRLLLAAAGVVVAVALGALTRGDGAAARVPLQDPVPAPPPKPAPPAARDAAWVVTGSAERVEGVAPDTTALRLLAWPVADGLAAVLARVPRLQRLDLAVAKDCPDLTEADLRAIGAHLTLRELRLTGRRELAPEWLSHLAGLPDLRVLALAHAALGDAAAERVARLPSLEVLDWGFDHALGANGVAAFASVPGLRDLGLRGCTGLDGAALVPLGALRRLERLDLDLCNGAKLTADRRLPVHVAVGAEALLATELMAQGGRNGGVDDGVLAALRACAALRELRVAGCRAVTRAGVEQLAKLPLRRLAVTLPEQDATAFADALPPTLEALSLAWSRRCDDAVLKTVAARLPLLRELDLAQCTAVTDDGLGALLAAASLRKLDLRGCSGLTAAALPHLLAARGLEALDLSGARWVDAEAAAALQALPAMRDFQCRRGGVLIPMPQPPRGRDR